MQNMSACAKGMCISNIHIFPTQAAASYAINHPTIPEHALNLRRRLAGDVHVGEGVDRSHGDPFCQHVDCVSLDPVPHLLSLSQSQMRITKRGIYFSVASSFTEKHTICMQDVQYFRIYVFFLCG